MRSILDVESSRQIQPQHQKYAKETFIYHDIWDAAGFATIRIRNEKCKCPIGNKER
jgi:hypothetical protein